MITSCFGFAAWCITTLWKLSLQEMTGRYVPNKSDFITGSHFTGVGWSFTTYNNYVMIVPQLRLLCLLYNRQEKLYQWYSSSLVPNVAFFNFVVSRDFFERWVANLMTNGQNFHYDWLFILFRTVVGLNNRVSKQRQESSADLRLL